MLLTIIFVAELIISAMLHGVVKLDNSVLVTCILRIYAIADCFAIYNDKKLNNLKNPIICGLIFRFILLYFDRYGKSIFILPNSGMDSEKFFQSAVSIARGVETRSVSAFSDLMGNIMKYVGTSRLLAQYIVVAFSIVSLVYIAYTINEISIDESMKSTLLWVVSLMPNFAILGSIFLRESLVTMFVAISCYRFILWMKNGNNIHFWLSIVFVFLGAQFHSGVVGILAGFLVARILYDSRSQHIHITFGSISVAIVFTIAFTYIYNNYGDKFFSKISGVENLDDIANTAALGGSSYAAYVGNSNSFVNMIIYTPLRLFYFLFSPFPWQWRGIADIIAFMFSSLFYVFSLYTAIKKLCQLGSRQRVKLLLWLIIALAVTFVFAWGVSNTGTATRHRDKLIPIYTTILAYSFATDQPVQALSIRSVHGSKYCKF